MFLNRIKFRHLQCFVEVARLKSVTAAAVELNVAQSAVSRTIAELEATVGVRLFERSRRGSILTSEGLAFFHQVAPSLAQIRDAYLAFGANKDVKEHFVVGALPTVSARLMPQSVQAFQSESPNVRVRVVEGRNADVLTMLRSGDVAFVVGRLARATEMQGLSFEHLYKEDIGIYVKRGHPKFGSKTAKFSELLQAPMVLNMPGTIVRDEIERYFYMNGIQPPSIVVETDSATLARSLAVHEGRVWISPKGMAQSDVDNGTLVRLDIRGWALEGSVGITTNPKTVLSPNAQRLLDTLRRVSEEIYISKM